MSLISKNLALVSLQPSPVSLAPLLQEGRRRCYPIGKPNAKITRYADTDVAVDLSTFLVLHTSQNHSCNPLPTKESFEGRSREKRAIAAAVALAVVSVLVSGDSLAAKAFQVLLELTPFVCLEV